MRHVLLFCFCLCARLAYSQQDVDSTFLNIINNPDKYHGKEIEIYGYVNFLFEGDSIALDTSNWRNRLWIEDIATELLPIKHLQFWNGRRVIMKGTFDRTNRGHLSMFKGAIKNVTILRLY